MSARVARGGWGALLLLAPRPLLEAGGVDTPGARIAARVLGARHLAEAVVLARAHDGRPRRWILGIDAVHGASMIMLAVVSPRLRRDALTSAASTGALIGLTLAAR